MRLFYLIRSIFCLILGLSFSSAFANYPTEPLNAPHITSISQYISMTSHTGIQVNIGNGNLNPDLNLKYTIRQNNDHTELLADSQKPFNIVGSSYYYPAPKTPIGKHIGRFFLGALAGALITPLVLVLTAEEGQYYQNVPLWIAGGAVFGGVLFVVTWR